MLVGLVLVAATISACGSNGDNGGGEAGGGDARSQLASGKESYAENCARCHGERGEGGTGPNLVGSDRPLENYETAAGLFEYVSTTMPFDSPGSLTDKQYYDAVAFLIDLNDRLPADTVINKDTAARVQLRGGQ